MANLNPVKGHEQGGYRPVLVVQNDKLNRNLNTVIVAPITSNLKAKGYLTTYFLKKSVSKLPMNSVALLFQIRTIDSSRLQKKVSQLSREQFRDVKRQMLICF